MKHIMGNFGATIPVNFQDDYTYQLMHPMVGSGAYIAITKGLNKNGGNLAVGHIWPRDRKLNLHNPKTGHTISKENLNKLYDLADSLQDYTFGTFDDIDVPFDDIDDPFEQPKEDYSNNSPTGIANPADYMNIVQEDTDNDGDIDKVSIEEKNEED